MTAIALTGADGGKLRRESEICIRVPSREVMCIQECHILIGHIICDLVERAAGLH